MLRFNVRPEKTDWMKLKYIVPDELQNLVELCLEYHTNRELLEREPANLEMLFGEVNTQIQNIVTEYNRVIKLTLNDDSIKKVEEDIKKILSRLLSQHGRLEVNPEGLIQAKKMNSVSGYLSAYFSTFDSLVTGRIYIPLKATIDVNVAKIIQKQFIHRSAEMSGIIPVFDQNKLKIHNLTEDATGD